mmetsp:Transcript_41003/g.112792  ORF Transcript_41003/g.112792 Transcript_41003/m.112792 type:complete len:723 (+) Transcript_41003:93-2261(+)
MPPPTNSKKNSKQERLHSPKGNFSNSNRPLAAAANPKESKKGSKSSTGRNATSVLEDAQDTSRKVADDRPTSSRSCSSSSGTVTSSVLAASQPVEDFLIAGLLPVVDQRAAGSGLLQVKPSDPIASVVEQLQRRRLCFCIVDFPGNRKEFFDCTDLHYHLLEVATAGAGSSTESFKSIDPEWSSMKEKLRRIADTPVHAALRSPRGASTFQRFESTESLDRLLATLRTRKRVPIYRGEELVRIVTATDVLGMCCCLSEDTQDALEQAILSTILAKRPGMLSTVAITEGNSMIEVLHQFKKFSVGAAPVLGETLTDTREFTRGQADGRGREEGQTLVGQFDVGLLRVMFARTPANNPSTSGPWWWEDSSVTTNVLLDPCMDFLALVPTSFFAGAKVSTPYNAVVSDESLARTISRTLASNYQSVVVYCASGASALGTAMGRTSSSEGRPRAQNIQGLLTTQALVGLMLEVGFFRSMRFDPSLAMQGAANEASGGARQGFRRSALSRSLSMKVGNIALPPADAVQRKTRVKFDTWIEVGHLTVPVCAEHDMSMMRFNFGDGAACALNFRALMDWMSDAAVIGAVAHCTGCQEARGQVGYKHLRLASLDSAVPLPVASATSGGMEIGSKISRFVWFGIFGFDAMQTGRGHVEHQSFRPRTSALKGSSKTQFQREEQQEKNGGVLLGTCSVCSVCRSDRLSVGGNTVAIPAQGEPPKQRNAKRSAR